MKIYLLALALALFVCSCGNKDERTFISADDPHIAYIGRFDLTDRENPVFMYSGCNIRTVFKGTSLEMVIKDDSMRNSFNVIILHSAWCHRHFYERFISISNMGV